MSLPTVRARSSGDGGKEGDNDLSGVRQRIRAVRTTAQAAQVASRIASCGIVPDSLRDYHGINTRMRVQNEARMRLDLQRKRVFRVEDS